jgi:carbonic anhydrase
MSRQPRRYAVCAAWALIWSLTAAAADEHKEKIEPPIKPAVAIPGIERAPAKPAAIAIPVVERAPADVAAGQRKRARNANVTRIAAVTTNPPAALEAVAPVAAPHSSHWSYEGENGPHAWAKLSPEYAKCGSGERQSPIDIRDGMKLDLDPIAFEYRPSGFKVIDNGHTIQANVGGWNAMRVMGRRFKLVQFHFHRPSEEMIDGRQFEMVVHLVHKDSEGRLAVVAVLVENGARQPAIQAVLNNLPLEKGEELAAATMLDLNQILPENRRYFTYMGSLTTPPCSEDVLWLVMKQPVQASDDQLNLFARLYPMNARPVQPMAGRTIKESN